MIAPEVRASVRALLEQGIPQREIARRCGVSKGTVARVASAVAQLEGTPEPSKPEASSVRPSAAAGARAELVTRHAVDTALDMAEEARLSGNLSAAAKLTRDALGGANTLARVEHQNQQNRDVITMTVAEERRGQAELDAALIGWAQYPLCCAACGTALRILVAHGVGVEEALNQLRGEHDLPPTRFPENQA